MKKILVLSDIHIPFHNVNVLSRAIDVGKEEKIDGIILNGDIIDFWSLSRFDKNPKKRNLRKELVMTRQFLQRLRKIFPKARIIFKQGNHETRLLKYLWSKAEEFADLPELTLESLLWFKQLKIEYSPEEKVIKVGDLTIIHGQEIRGTLSTYPARTGYIAAKTNVLFGHCHRASFYETRDVNNKVYKAYSTGCLCKLSADYSIHNEWTSGCGLITLKANGRTEVKLISL